ncbi:hypothetical protein Q3G72_025418 [Acer saccharum]|nr:hypothetical protein Q3G72_025418 [Acer saccharum]
MVKHHPGLIMCRKQPGISIGRLVDVLSAVEWESLMLTTAKSVLSKDKDGCPKIVNMGSAKTDLFYECKKYGLKKK